MKCMMHCSLIRSIVFGGTVSRSSIGPSFYRLDSGAAWSLGSGGDGV